MCTLSLFYSGSRLLLFLVGYPRVDRVHSMRKQKKNCSCPLEPFAPKGGHVDRLISFFSAASDSYCHAMGKSCNSRGRVCEKQKKVP